MQISGSLSSATQFFQEKLHSFRPTVTPRLLTLVMAEDGHGFETSRQVMSSPNPRQWQQTLDYVEFELTAVKNHLC